MNVYKQLELEMEGIRGIIQKYSASVYTKSSLNQLENGIKSVDYEVITYSLDKLITWYTDNWFAITHNKFVYNLHEHEKNRALLIDIRKRLTEQDCKEEQNRNTAEIDSTIVNSNSSPLIFISHRSSDRKYGDALRNFITGLGVQDNQLIYTSHPLHKIPLDQNIYDYLRENIHQNIFMIILWSDEYLESPVCMNEMGAAWVVQSDYTNIYTPNFSFGNPKYHQCAVDTSKMGAVLNGDAHCRSSMVELKEKIVNMFHLQVDEQRFVFLLDQFMKEIA